MPTGLRPLHARDPSEKHRAATQLELFFDLVSVIAIAAVSQTLHHAISEAHGLGMLVNFIALFAVIWWAWMNFTWFASAFDNGDTLYSLLTLVVMAGAIIFAGGVSSITKSMNFSFALAGWIIMRLGMIALWLRAAYSNPAYRTTAVRYAVGIAIAQILWTALYFTIPSGHIAFLLLFAAIFVVELAVPVFAEKARQTPWHRHHVIERYGLLNIIVLGEVLVSISLMFGKLYEGKFDVPLIIAALSGLIIVISLWWLYFLEAEHLDTTQLRRALIWGYGHVIVFGSGALVAAGLGAVMDVVTHHSQIDAATAARWANAPVAGYLFGLWFIRDRFRTGTLRQHLLLAASGVVAVLAVLGTPVWVCAAVMVLVVVLRSAGSEQAAGQSHHTA
ncbi:MAG TPA: low temperature requirement protein A [Vineibacter sp.]|nr:low temperature requirement protein A [Vineibacter sp.]